MSRSCSITITVAPSLIKVWKTFSKTFTSNGWSPIDGSSNMKMEFFWLLPISDASFSLWASPPDKLGVASPIVKYPNPKFESFANLFITFFRRDCIEESSVSIIDISSIASSIVNAIISLMDNPFKLISSASLEYLRPLQSGQVISTSGRNWTSIEIVPVPLQLGHLRLPVLYEKSDIL